MDFAPTPAQKELQAEFAALGPVLATWQDCVRAGLPGLPLPAAFGGRGLSALDTGLALEAAARGGADEGLLFSVCAHMQGVAVPLLRYGTAEQKERWLAGDAQGAVCATEEEAGSDVARMRTSARRLEDGWRLDGTKRYVTNAPTAGLFLVYALTDEARRPHGGHSAFLVERARIRVEPEAEKMGLAQAPWGRVVLDGSRGELLGSDGDGLRVFGMAMAWERLQTSFVALGCAERVLRETVEHARRRRLGSFQAVSHRLADLHIELEASRLLLYRAAWGGPERGPEVSMARVHTLEARLQVTLAALRLRGAEGVLLGGPETELRNALPSAIASGTLEVQRNIVARHLRLDG